MKEEGVLKCKGRQSTRIVVGQHGVKLLALYFSRLCNLEKVLSNSVSSSVSVHNQVSESRLVMKTE